MQFSFWEKESFLGNFDVLIIGSGIVGLNAALSLKIKSPFLKIAILERGLLPSGASTKNAGFACFGSITELMDDVKLNGEDAMLQLVEKRWRGLLALRKLLGDDQIDYLNLGGNEVFSLSDRESFENSADSISYYNNLLKNLIGKDVFSVQSKMISENGLTNFNQLINNKYEGQIHTGKMMKALRKKVSDVDIEIFNGYEITGLEENSDNVIVQNSKGISLKAKNVLVCTNGFSKRLFPNIEVIPARNQVLITEPIPGLKLNGSFHYQKGYIYFRNIENRILLGGGRHLFQKEETTDIMEITDSLQGFLESFLDKHFENNNRKLKIDMRWSGILGVGNEKSPIITKYSDHIFTAVRLGGMGVAIGTEIGREAADFLLKHL